MGVQKLYEALRHDLEEREKARQVGVSIDLSPFEIVLAEQLAECFGTVLDERILDLKNWNWKKLLETYGAPHKLIFNYELFRALIQGDKWELGVRSYFNCDAADNLRTAAKVVWDFLWCTFDTMVVDGIVGDLVAEMEEWDEEEVRTNYDVLVSELWREKI